MPNDVIPSRPRDPAPTPQQISDALDQIVSTHIDQPNAVTRALVTVILAEFNRHTAVEAAMFAAVASATNLADIKAGFAAIQAVPTRQFTDLRTAIRSALGS